MAIQKTSAIVKTIVKTVCHENLPTSSFSSGNLARNTAPAKGPSPQAARTPFALELAPAFYGGSVRLEPPIHKLPAPNHHPSREMRHP